MGHDEEQKAVLYMDGKQLGSLTYIPEVTLDPTEGEERIIGADLAQGGDFTERLVCEFWYLTYQRWNWIFHGKGEDR